MVTKLLTSIRICQICTGLPLGPRPIIQASAKSKILIAGQAPGQITHHKGIPFDDPSGERLRLWLGIDRNTFYNPENFAIIPMGFCYPGKGKSGDLPPRAECAKTWHDDLLASLHNIELKLVIGQYAHAYYLGDSRQKTLTETVINWRTHWPDILPLPHPSPRNISWFKRNEWFERNVLPVLQVRVREVLG